MFSTSNEHAITRSGNPQCGDNPTTKSEIRTKSGDRKAGITIWRNLGEKIRHLDRVAPGGFPPGAPTDPNVRN